MPDITRGSYLFFLKPVIAAFLAVVFLNQGLTTPQILAIIVICASTSTEAQIGRLRFGKVEVDMERLQVTRWGKLVDLTPTEFRLLRYLVSNPDRPFSRDELIEAVWGYASDVGSDRTVDVHIRHLRKKLEDAPADPRWLVTVRGVGYKFER